MANVMQDRSLIYPCNMPQELDDELLHSMIDIDQWHDCRKSSPVECEEPEISKMTNTNHWDRWPAIGNHAPGHAPKPSAALYAIHNLFSPLAAEAGHTTARPCSVY